MKVILISFSAAKVITLKNVLKAQGHDVVTEKISGYRVLKRMIRTKMVCDVVVFDLDTHSSRGLEAGAAFSGDAAANKIPRLWLDGSEEDRDRIRANISADERFVTTDELLDTLIDIKRGR